MADRIRPTPRFRWLNVAVLAAMYAALLLRDGSFSLSYRAALVAGAVILVMAVSAVFGRDPIASWTLRPSLARPRVRAFFGVAPWILLIVVLAARGLWWRQQAWALKLFATYALAVWSASWYRASPESAATGGPARTLLLTTACVLIVLGIDGLAFGTSPLGVGVSAVLACLAFLVGGVAQFATPAGRDRLLTAAFGVGLGLCTVEAGVRIFHLGENLQEVDNPAYVRQFHHITPPGAAFINQPKPLDEFPPALVEINSLGIRGPEIPPGPVDVMLLGDSMIEARQLPWEQTLSAKLPQSFAARSARVRVVGHGVRGWAPLLEWNWYLKAGRQLKPKDVLLFFFWNDLWSSGDEAHTFQAVMGPDGRPDHFEVPVDPGWVWYKHVRTVRIADGMVERIGLGTIKRTWSMIGGEKPGVDEVGAEATARRMAADAMLTRDEVDALLTEPHATLSPRLQRVVTTEFWPGIRPLDLWTEAQRASAAKTEDELRRFAEDVAADGGRLVVVYVPNVYQVSPSECRVARLLDGIDDDRLMPPDSGIQAWLRGVTERHHIELIDPSDAMRAFEQSQPAGAAPLYLRSDCHWAERGHQFMADFLADWYLRSRAGGR